MSSRHSNQWSCLCQRPRAAGLWLALLALPGLAAPDAGARQELDRVVAAVEDRVITASQLEFEARVLLINAGGLAAATAPLDGEALASSLNAIIDLRVATLEAEKLGAWPVEPLDLERAVDGFRARFRNDGSFREFLARHEAVLDDLREVLRRGLRAQRALDGKLRLKAQVSEAEARLYQGQHPELAQQPLEAVRARLFSQRFNALVREELAQARRQAQVRLLGPFAPGAAAGSPP